MKVALILYLLLGMQSGSMFISRVDAERILGQEVRVTNASEDLVEGVNKSRMAYAALEKDPESGSEIKLWLGRDVYPSEVAATEHLKFLRSENRTWNRDNELRGFGDEAVFHTDQENFYTVIIRKANRIYLAKINKLTKKADTRELLRVLRTMPLG